MEPGTVSRMEPLAPPVRSVDECTATRGPGAPTRLSLGQAAPDRARRYTGGGLRSAKLSWCQYG
jgi:hypothetical protein